MQTTLSIVGCGKLGRTLGRLWADTQVFAIQDILNRSLHSAQDAAAFIGAGRAVAAYADLQPADIYLIAAPDDQLAACCDALAAGGHIGAGSVVFHCSGAAGSSVLNPARQCGAAVASIHPIRSFANPAQLVQDFAGTWCGAEGDQAALVMLTPAFAAIGAQTVAIERDKKVLYHAAAVFASNYLVTLLDVAQQAYMEAGIAPDVALQLMAPLVRATADNVFRLGPPAALTGPIARGDMATVERQQQAVTQWQQPYGELYRAFATLTGELAARRKDGKG